MNTKKIMHFLKDIAANNNRQWFQEHKAEYDAVKADFENLRRRGFTPDGKGLHLPFLS